MDEVPALSDLVTKRGDRRGTAVYKHAAQRIGARQDESKAARRGQLLSHSRDNRCLRGKLSKRYL